MTVLETLFSISKLPFTEFCLGMKKVLRQCWIENDSIDWDRLPLSQIVLHAETDLDTTTMPFDMLVQVVEFYRVQSIADLDEHKAELIALSNWSAKHAGITIEIKESTIAGAGFGLFATAPIARSTNIAPYGGIVLTGGVKLDDDSYALETPSRQTVDSSVGFRLREMARWANGFPSAQNWSSSSVSSPIAANNCAFASDPESGGGVCIASMTEIAAGEELFCSYGDRYCWEKCGFVRIL